MHVAVVLATFNGIKKKLLITNPMLDRFFDPGSIAVVGASSRAGKVGTTLLKNLRAFQGSSIGQTGEKARRLYAVNPKCERILDIACYLSVTEIKEQVDLAVVAVPAATVLGS